MIEYGNSIVRPFVSGKIKPSNAIIGDSTTSGRFGENTMGIVPNMNRALSTILEQAFPDGVTVTFSTNNDGVPLAVYEVDSFQRDISTGHEYCFLTLRQVNTVNDGQ